MKQSHTKRRIWIILGLVLICLAAYLLASLILGGKPQPAYNIIGPDQKGTLHSLSDQFGRRGTVLLFFDTKTEKAIELLEQIAGLSGNYDVNVVTVAVNGDYEKQKKELARLKLPEKILVLFDVEGEMAKTYNINSTPVTYFIDKNGMVQDVFLSSITDKSLKKSMDALD